MEDSPVLLFKAIVYSRSWVRKLVSNEQEIVLFLFRYRPFAQQKLQSVSIKKKKKGTKLIPTVSAKIKSRQRLERTI